MGMQKLSRRQFLAVSATALGAAAIAACGAAPTPTPTPKPAAAAPAAPAATPAPAMAGGKMVFWPEWGGKDADALKAQVDKFTQQTGTSVDFLPVRDHARIVAALSAGAPPDLLMTWDANTVGGWGFGGALKNLEPYIEKDNWDMKQYVPMGVAAGNLMGIKQIGLPLTNYLTSVLYWNKDTFKDAGVDPEAPPATWEDLWTLSQKITIFQNGQLTRLGYDVTGGQDAHPTCMAFGYGGSIWSADFRQVTPDSDANIEGLNWMRQFFVKYTTAELIRWLGASNTDASTPGFGLYQVKSGFAMQLTGEWMPSYFDALTGVTLNMGATEMPYPAAKPDVKGTMTANSNPMVIPADSTNPDAGWAFIKFITMPENSAPMCVIVGNASPTYEGVKQQAAATQNAMYKNLLTNVWATANVKSMTINSPIGAQYNDAYATARDSVLQDGDDPVATMKQLKDTIQPQLDAALKKLGI